MSTENEEDIDLDNADRGDNLEEFEDTEGKDQERDEAGRFKSKKGGAEDGEADEEEEEEEEEEGEGDEEGEGSDDDKSGKSDDKNYPIRLRKAQEKLEREREAREAAERRLAELEAQAKSRSPADKKDEVDPRKEINDQLDTMYEQVEEARAEGDAKGAAKLQREIDTLNRKLGALEAEQTAIKVAQASTEEQRFDAMLAAMESAVPVLDPNHDDFDAEAVKELEFQVAAYEKMGLSPTKALAKAVKVLHQIEPFGTKPAPKEKEESAAKPPAKKPDVAKAVDTSRRQPPDASNRGVNRDSTKIKVTALSDEEFEKLPESKKAELRGDHI